ncbi:MAG: 4Fe-4S dicluster domain-containing protein [Helicobacteraceae bacterium]|jgi:succinate dehydrogenase / fumarate reductase iron-sulfur subunit|nr:4Fe-4S dicluster domain-containing protein [Helicobacteraceae bacterium]
MEITFNIFRFNAQFDYTPRYQSYRLEVKENEVTLDILNRIKADIDSTISYRRSCRHGICGSCAIKVNNKAVLACKENIYKLVETFGDELFIDPLDRRLAIKDLIVDKTDFWQKYREIRPWQISEIASSPMSENLISPVVTERIEGADGCIECGACYYSCPASRVNERFLGPHALTKLFRFAVDIRDTATIERLDMVNAPASGIWDCVKCMECKAVCPKKISPIDKITKLHLQSFVRSRAPNNPATRHSKVFLRSIENCGRLDENVAVRYSLGFLALKHVKTALKMLRRKKLPKKTTPIERLDEVKKLIEIARRSR